MKKLIIRSLILMSLVFTGFKGLSQTCSTNPDDYIPLTPNESPVTYIRLSFDVIRSGTGTGNIDATNTTIRNYLTAILNAMNTDEQNNDYVRPGYSGLFIKDTRIQYVLEGMYNWDDATTWGEVQSNPFDITTITTDFESLPNYSMPTHSATYLHNTIHVLLLESATSGGTNGQSIDIPLLTTERHELSMFQAESTYTAYAAYIAAGNTGAAGFLVWSYAHLILHEIGHSIGGLGHVGGFFVITGCPNLYNYYQTTNDKMDYSPGGGASLTDCQIASTYANLNNFPIPVYFPLPTPHYVNYYPAAPSFIVPVWKDPIPSPTIITAGGSTADMVISSGTISTWNTKKYLHSNLIIQNGATLTINCYVDMPPVLS